MSIWKHPEYASRLQRPLARHADPATSHQAAEHMRESGKLDSQLAEVYEIVKTHPHATAFELTEWTTLDRYQIQRRLSDLASLGKVKASATGRRCAKSGRNACTWSAS